MFAISGNPNGELCAAGCHVLEAAYVSLAIHMKMTGDGW